jgi:hypothetical protein
LARRERKAKAPPLLQYIGKLDRLLDKCEARRP